MPPNLGKYVPTLANRASEMNGLEYLPALSKDNMHPLFLLAPWPNALQLSRAMERIERAYPNRHYFLDIDRDYVPTDPDNSAQGDWIELNNPTNNFSAWSDFWQEWENARPCLMLKEQTQYDLEAQIKLIQSKEREFCLRVELDRVLPNLDIAVEALNEIGTSDFTVVIDGGWVSNPLEIMGRAHGLIEGVLSTLEARIPFVVSCTSMPKAFSDIEGVKPHAFNNRELLHQLQRQSNRNTILYGDWGSTKPREKGFGRPLPRIDYPTDNSWLLARNKDEDWSFQEAAEAILDRDEWQDGLGIWGEQMIENTALGSPAGINSPQKNVAARVNIHLHRQAQFGRDIIGIDLDEDWED